MSVTALPLDPTIPTATVPSAAGSIVLCCDFAVLIDAEAELIAAGHDVNLMQCLHTPLTASGVRAFFAIAARRFQPSLTYADALKLFTLQNAPEITNAIGQTWQNAMPKSEGGTVVADPPAPSGDSGESNTGSGSLEPPVVSSASGSRSFED